MSRYCATFEIPEELVSRIRFDALHEYVVRKGVKPSAPEAELTKEELRDQLLLGRALTDILTFRNGQECEIFKTDHFIPGDTIIYMPDIWLNEIPIDDPISDTEMLDDIISFCYTGADFISVCGNAEKAERLFHYVDWQSPSAAIHEIEDDEEDD